MFSSAQVLVVISRGRRGGTGIGEFSKGRVVEKGVNLSGKYERETKVIMSFFKNKIGRRETIQGRDGVVEDTLAGGDSERFMNG